MLWACSQIPPSRRTHRMLCSKLPKHVQLERVRVERRRGDGGVVLETCLKLPLAVDECEHLERARVRVDVPGVPNTELGVNF